MRKRAIWAALVAFIFGCFGFHQYAEHLRSSISGGEKRAVLLLTADLRAGQELSESDLSRVMVPENYLNSRSVPEEEKAKVLASKVQNNLQAGDLLLWSDLEQALAPRHLASLVAQGRRAYTLKASANPLGDLLRAGDQVDVLLERGGSSEVLLENILVLAQGQQLVRVEGGEQDLRESVGRSQGVTLSVTQEEATKLFAADSRGNLLLVLRNAEDQARFLKGRAQAAKHASARSSAAQAQTEEAGVDHVR